MKIELTLAEYRRLLDLVFLGNIVLGLPNPTSEESRLYDKLTRDIFSYCPLVGLGENVHIVDDELFPSDKYCDAGVMQKLLWPGASTRRSGYFLNTGSGLLRQFFAFMRSASSGTVRSPRQ